MGLSLLISTIIGFCCAAALLLLAKRVLRQPELYEAPKGDTPPPAGIRALLVLTCTGVSFAHGSNDGQKGMGLMMLILIGILPGAYALNPGAGAPELQAAAGAAQSLNAVFERRAESTAASDPAAELTAFLKPRGTAGPQTWAALAAVNRELVTKLQAPPGSDPRGLRIDIYMVSKSISKLNA